jgi:hypothetical protein
VLCVEAVDAEVASARVGSMETPAAGLEVLGALLRTDTYPYPYPYPCPCPYPYPYPYPYP